MAISQFVFDASVLVARLRTHEPGHYDSANLIKALIKKDSTLLIPAIALAEVASALARGTKRPELANKSIEELTSLNQLKVITIDDQLGLLAAKIAAKYRLRGCDAVYAGLALAFEAPLITLDRQQLERTPDTMLSWTPAEALRQLQ